jgi:aspartate aminotransferase
MWSAADRRRIDGACHNPTGADLSQQHWQRLADLWNRRGLVPFVDLAYQGLGDGLDEDAYGARILAEQLRFKINRAVAS